VVAPSASRLGLTLRETPAAVEVVGAQTMQEQGYQTIWDAAKGATGVQAGNNPKVDRIANGALTRHQGRRQASGYTLLPMQTANLASVEFLKGKIDAVVKHVDLPGHKTAHGKGRIVT
jgi:iron complex outermembrane receptor protein